MKKNRQNDMTAVPIAEALIHVLEYPKYLPFLQSTIDRATAFDENFKAIKDTVATVKIPNNVAKKLCKYVSW